MFFNRIAPYIYAFIKKSNRTRKVVSSVWDFYLGLKIKVEGILFGSEILPPPAGVLDNLSAPLDGQWHKLNESINFLKLTDPFVMQRQLPKTIDEIVHWKFKKYISDVQPETFLMTVKGGRFYDDGAVITAGDQILPQVSKTIYAGRYYTDIHKHAIFKQSKLFPLKKVKGTIAVLTAPAGRGYYHWMLDLLPRIKFIRDGGFAFEDIDGFLVNSYISKFHMETLNLIGIPNDKLIKSQNNPHLQADLLVVPSLVGETGSVPKFACTFLKEEFLKKVPPALRKNRRVYLNRGKVGHRRVTNEADVINLLGQYGFESIALETLSFADQVTLITEAAVVIGPHGAGLTNIAFCNEGTKVIEFLYPSAVNVMYWTICNELNLDYYYLLAEGEQPPEGEDLYLNSDDMLIDLKKLESTLQLAALTKTSV